MRWILLAFAILGEIQPICAAGLIDESNTCATTFSSLDSKSAGIPLLERQHSDLALGQPNLRYERRGGRTISEILSSDAYLLSELGLSQEQLLAPLVEILKEAKKKSKDGQSMTDGLPLEKDEDMVHGYVNFEGKEYYIGIIRMKPSEKSQFDPKIESELSFLIQNDAGSRVHFSLTELSDALAYRLNSFFLNPIRLSRVFFPEKFAQLKEKTDTEIAFFRSLDPKDLKIGSESSSKEVLEATRINGLTIAELEARMRPDAGPFF